MNSKDRQQLTAQKIKVGTAVVIMDADHKILLGKRQNVFGAGDWGLPGGHVKLGESLSECAKREVYEEVGVDLIGIDLLETVDVVNTGLDYQLIEVGFITHKWEGIVELREHKYCSEWNFFPLDGLPENLFEAHAPIIQKVVRRQKGIDEEAMESPSLFDYLHPHFKVAVQTFVINKQGQLLMGLRCDPENKGSWAVPGGHLDLGDTLEECAMRELREETGLVAKHARQFAYVEQPMNISNMHYFHFGYLVTEFEDKPVINGEPEDIERWEWIDMHKIPYKIASYQREIIIKFLKFKNITLGKK